MSLTKAKLRMIDGSANNVQDFGAVGDGVTDDTAAIQACLDASDGKTVYMPAGTYMISSELDISGRTIIGEYDGYRNASGTIIKAINAGTHRGLNQVNLGVNGITMRLENLRLEGFTDGVRMFYPVNSVLRRIHVVNPTNDGIILGVKDGIAGPVFNYVENCEVRSATRYGLNIGGGSFCNANTVQGGYYSGAVGVYMDGLATPGIGGMANNMFKDCEMTGTIGFKSAGGNISTTLTNIYFEPGKTCIHMANNTWNLMLNNNLYAGGFDFDVSSPAVIQADDSIFSCVLNGGTTYNTNASTPNYHFINAPNLPDEDNNRRGIKILQEPVRRGSHPSTGYQGLTNFSRLRLTGAEGDRTVSTLYSSANDYNSVRSFREVVHVNDSDGLDSGPVTIATIEDAAIAFASAFIHIRVIGSCENLTSSYDYGIYLELDITADATSVSLVEAVKRGTGTSNLIVSATKSGDDIVVTLEDTTNSTRYFNAIVEINATGQFIDITQ